MDRRAFLRRLAAVGLVAALPPLYEPRRSYFFGGWFSPDPQTRLYDPQGRVLGSVVTRNRVGLYTADSLASITEAGLFSGDGVLVARHEFTPVNLMAGDSLSVTWEFTLSLTGK